MPRAVWTGALSFGLVSIPVSLYPATSPKDVRFHLFDRQGRRVRYRRVAESAAGSDDRPEPGAVDDRRPMEPARLKDDDGPKADDRSAAMSRGNRSGDDDERELAFDELVRGYEVEPGRFAMLEPEEIERARPERSRTIELEHFVELADIDPVFFEKSYHVAPRSDAEKPYTLLHRTLERAERVGIGRFVLRTKPHLVAVRASGEALVLETLYFADEVRSAADVLTVADVAVSERELTIAEQLVGMLATSWEPDRYADEYRQELLRIIGEKEAVETPDSTEPFMPGLGAEELMEALRRSVEEAKAHVDEVENARRTG